MLYCCFFHYDHTLYCKIIFLFFLSETQITAAFVDDSPLCGTVIAQLLVWLFKANTDISFLEYDNDIWASCHFMVDLKKTNKKTYRCSLVFSVKARSDLPVMQIGEAKSQCASNVISSLDQQVVLDF